MEKFRSYTFFLMMIINLTARWHWLYNGVIVKYKFSSKVHHTEDKITFVDLKKGDLRLTAEYKVDLITEPYKLIALKQSGDFSGGTYADASHDVGSTSYRPGEGGSWISFPDKCC